MTSSTPTLRCLACGYDIASLVEQRGRDEPGVCPECGEDLRDVVRAPAGSAWQQNPRVLSFFTTHAATLAQPIKRYRRVNDRSSLWLAALSVPIAVFVPVLLGSLLIWWTLQSGVAGHAPFASFFEGVQRKGLTTTATDPLIAKESAARFIGLSISVLIVLLPGLLYSFSASAVAPRARTGLSVVLPHTLGWTLVPAIITVVGAVVLCVARYIQPNPRHSAGGEWFIFFLLLSMVVANIGMIVSATAGVAELRRRHPDPPPPNAPPPRT